MTWATRDTELIAEIEHGRNRAIEAYRANPKLIEEHAGLEEEAGTGGYGKRQVFELVQNGTDQLDDSGGRISVLLTEDALYCANSGRPFSPSGLVNLLHAYVSEKSDEEIGKFGLGFKSVLGVTKEPVVLSRSGSFRFGPDVAAKYLHSIVQVGGKIPALRIAEAVHPDTHFDTDPALVDFRDWATTIIKLPFAEVPWWLLNHLRDFPAEFLIFAPKVDRLELESRVPGSEIKRDIAAERNFPRVRIVEQDEAIDWLVFFDEVPLDADAKVKAGRLADRDEVTVSWAVQEEGRSVPGKFWSYFPTQDETTLRGALNAPWQLTPDRLHLIEESAYNRALLQGAADLVAHTVEELHGLLSDPGRHLDLVPARGKEARGWADGVLTEETNSRLSLYPVAPMLSGELGLANEVRLHPRELPPEALSAWRKVAEPEDWVHHAIEGADRRSRIEKYSVGPSPGTATLQEWIEYLLRDNDPGSCIAAVRVVDTLLPQRKAEVADIRFVLTEDCKWVSPSEPGLCLPGEFDATEQGVLLVHPEVASTESATRTLRQLGIEKVSAEAELRRLIHAYSESEDPDWEYFWSIARQVPEQRATELIVGTPGFTPFVITVAGSFASPRMALLPGPCVPRDGSRDAGVTVDIHWHAHEIPLLKRIGCVATPEANGGSIKEPWFQEYLDDAVQRFLNSNSGFSPSRDAIDVELGSFPGPMSMLRALSEEGKAAFVKAAFDGMDELKRRSVKHRRHSHYKSITMPNPAVWLIEQDGVLPTPLGPRRPNQCVAPRLRCGDLVPAAECSEALAQALGLPTDWKSAPQEIVSESLARALQAEPSRAADLYATMSADIARPESLRCTRLGNNHISVPAEEDLFVCSDPRHRELLDLSDKPLIFVSDEDTKVRLIERWELKDAASLIQGRLEPIEPNPPIPLIDLFSPLKKRLPETDRDLTVVRCSELSYVEESRGGSRSTPVEIRRDGNTIYCLESFDDYDLLKRLNQLLQLGLSSDNIRRVILKVEDEKVREFRKRVARAESEIDKLQLLVSESDLAKRVPETALNTYEVLHGPPTHRQLAELALSVHGVHTLVEYKDAIEATGIETPSKWGGTQRAREFVRSLGFDEAYAGFPQRDSEPEIIVEGFPELNDLHDYQELIAEEIRDLVGRTRDNKGMVSLPTGSGKTRVTIEGLLRALLDGTVEPNLILWIAQTDELCEQAVQSWLELWRARAMPQQLTLSRFWGSRDASPADEGVQVVVSTVQQLQRRTESSEYSWLSRPGVVVIDEAHASTAPSYGRIREWLGVDRGKFGAPVIGLSATPYRGRNVELTERLVKLYGGTRLDSVAFADGDHYPKLQELGVISRVEHVVLEGSEISLTEEELSKLVTDNLLPKSADERLGRDVSRTERIVKSIAELPPDWPVLVFAPSVDNAKALAGLLSARGVNAAAIDGGTPRGARRWCVEQFRAGRIQVITNYRVLAEGFDAPAVRAVYVARPVYSPNLYQQMIGRGLRGVLNGGKAECLIVDVEDNILNFDRELAFREFEYLWETSEEEQAV